MNIESFVSEALRQIGAGVNSAHGKPGIKIASKPFRVAGTESIAGHMIDEDSKNLISLVEFDLSVVVQAKLEGEASAKLEVAGFSFGGGKVDSGIDQTRTQRIKFQIPVTFPKP
ncbi:MAG TPA: hypothetical protein VMF08_01435 [Candidatus Sulfotelmatobacter sp.]|nr:hypothetical protein [Candidatus Sulfotelmatobacter sp.]